MKLLQQESHQHLVVLPIHHNYQQWSHNNISGCISRRIVEQRNQFVNGRERSIHFPISTNKEFSRAHF
uniref:Ovule protein n=1 Tax=Meloidogyne incognita TaxID=6306 RepID=A0A914LF79_MELIC